MTSSDKNRRLISVAFSDFIFHENLNDKLASFDPENNFILESLKENYLVRVTEMQHAEVLIYSAFGHEHTRFKGRKIFYSSENVLPDFQECDYAITFSHLSDNPRHYRLPQYIFYVNDVNALVKSPVADLRAQLKAKTKFANFIVSNPRGPERNRFFKMLNRRKGVDSGGRHFNNLGTPIINKQKFIRDYKFTLAFENSSTPGYTTEKILEAMLAGSIPIYWGNPEIAKDFNPQSFIDVSSFPSFEAAIDHILEVDRNDELYLSYLREPWFNHNTPPSWFNRSEHAGVLKRFLDEPWVERPRIYKKRGLRDHVRGTGIKRHLSSLACRLESVFWRLGWQ